MKRRSRPPEQDDLLRPRLVDMIDPRHELVKLAARIDWEVFEERWSGFFPSGTGRPASPPRLVAGLLYLQHAFRLSDEAVGQRTFFGAWVGPEALARLRAGQARLTDNYAHPDHDISDVKLDQISPA